MQGYSIPETTRAYGAVLLNADREEFTDSLGPRDEVSQAIVDEVAAGRGVETPDGRPGRLPRHDPDRRGRRRTSRSRTCSAATVPAASTRSTEPILTYPVLHYQNGGLVIDEHVRDDRRGPLRLRRDRRRHARAEPDDGQLAARVHGLRPARRARRPRRGRHEHRRDRSPPDGRGRGRAPLRLGAEGHPAGPARRARGREGPGDLRSRPARAGDDRQERPGRRDARTTSSARTRGSPSTRAVSASTSRCIRAGSTRR